MGAIIVGAVYVYSWIVGAIASVGGLVMHIAFNHQYSYYDCNPGYLQSQI